MGMDGKLYHISEGWIIYMGKNWKDGDCIGKNNTIWPAKLAI
jgi:hypothetical protein